MMFVHRLLTMEGKDGHAAERSARPRGLDAAARQRHDAVQLDQALARHLRPRHRVRRRHRGERSRLRAPSDAFFASSRPGSPTASSSRPEVSRHSLRLRRILAMARRGRVPLLIRRPREIAPATAYSSGRLRPGERTRVQARTSDFQDRAAIGRTRGTGRRRVSYSRAAPKPGTTHRQLKSPLPTWPRTRCRCGTSAIHRTRSPTWSTTR